MRKSMVSPATATPACDSASVCIRAPPKSKRITEKSLVPPPKSATSTVSCRRIVRAYQ
jgi:hypothetical protein